MNSTHNVSETPTWHGDFWKRAWEMLGVSCCCGETDEGIVEKSGVPNVAGHFEGFRTKKCIETEDINRP